MKLSIFPEYNLSGKKTKLTDNYIHISKQKNTIKIGWENYICADITFNNISVIVFNGCKRFQLEISTTLNYFFEENTPFMLTIDDETFYTKTIIFKKINTKSRLKKIIFILSEQKL